GVPTLVDFFGRALAERLRGEGRSASLIVANNVLAQVPDVNDFLSGVRVLLRAEGTATFEFPHLLRLLEDVQYDTIYHEHFSYFSLGTLVEILGRHGLEAYDVEELPTHGGSLRVYVQHAGGPHPTREAVASVLAREEREGLRSRERYARFAKDVEESKRALLELLIDLRRAGKHVVGYGAPGKGNTLLNYCGIRTDLLEYTVDRNPYKHGRYTPGTHIPIHPPERIEETRPDYVLVLPWNLVDEIARQLAFIRRWGGKLIVPIPRATVIEPGPGASERLLAARSAA
ncbi:MAG: class I SAM-dependent methyltransferase, partial [Thermoleophilia bacterium]|nr:class I SAM-dependent methyltransferase [Thermoleophilia bacterium]